MDKSIPASPSPEPVPAEASAPVAKPAKAKPSARAQRLATALRDNLKRRKAAGRAERTVKPSN